MKALQIAAPFSVQLTEINEPKCGDGEVLLRIKYVGFCGSDLNTYRGKNPMAKMPVIPGHEVGAEIEAVGNGVPENLVPGMSVTVNPYTNCGKCASCRNGRPNACEHNETFGVQRDGTMTEFVAVPWQKIIPADNLPADVCALIEPMSVGFHAVARGCVTDIDTVMVIGCGMVGLGAVARASQRGASVIAVDVDDEKLEIARLMGASHTVNSKTEDLHMKLQKITEGYGPDVIIEAVGSPQTYQTAVNEVGFTGRVVCIGYAKDETSFQTKLFVQKELDIRGSRNASPSDFKAVIRFLKKGTCPTDKLISYVAPMEQAGKMLEKWAENPGKIFRILIEIGH